MAEKNKTSGNSSRSGGSGNNSTERSRKPSAGTASGAERGKSEDRPSRTDKRNFRPEKGYGREIAGVLCLLVGIAVLFCGFSSESLIARFIRGLFGKVGCVFLPIGLILCFLSLTFHGGKPSKMRVFCAILFVVLASAISHLILVADLQSFSHTISNLYATGKAGASGGVFGGMLAHLLSFLGGKYAAWVIGLILLIAVLCASLNLTLAGFFRAWNKKKEDNVIPPKKRREPAEVLVDHISQRQVDRAVKKQTKTSAGEFAYDLPVDDPPALHEGGKRKRSGAAPESPEEYIRRRREEKEAEESADKGSPFPDAERRKASRPVPGETRKPLSAGVNSERLPDKNQPEHSTPAPVIETFTGNEHPLNPQQNAAKNPDAVPETLPPIAEEERIEKVSRSDAKQSAREIAQEIVEKAEEQSEYVYPDVSLLKKNKDTVVDGSSEIEENTGRLRDILACFNVDAEIIKVTRGPSVTMYELELAQGVRLNRLTTLADDIALQLGAASVRISAIPDKISVVGIEVPNKLVSPVSLREVLDSPAFRNAASPISFAVGKDISGNCIVGDIAKLPHMLIAGTTGSGKSVCMNSIIISLLYKSSPDEVRLIMVDPKMVELGGYNGIPHLLIPVVTEPKKAAGALQWTVSEMMRRYRLMSEAGAKDLDSYNKHARELGNTKTMEQIVVVIDELADLMIAAAKEVEESICRIAQMGRAAGIHLLIATQRPSADVITGLMKANIPSRIAFAVSSAMESRIILDTVGAEKLVGKGDMLFAPLGKGKPKRVQGSFVSEDEVQNVIDFVKANSAANYSEEVQQQIELKVSQQDSKGHNSDSAPSGDSSDEEGDELFPAAVDVIMETGQASVSMLQRRLKLGYARAARIVDEMEERGIVGPFEGSKPRQLLITKEQWQAMQSGAQMPADEVPEDGNSANDGMNP